MGDDNERESITWDTAIDEGQRQETDGLINSYAKAQYHHTTHIC